MRINLANYDVLPTLVQGKVIALDCTYGKQLAFSVSGRKISMLTIGKYTVLPDGDINPVYFDILVTDHYTVIVNAHHGVVLNAVKDYLDNKNSSIIDDVMNLIKDCQPVIYKTGDKIHLKDKMGIYEIANIQNDDVVITCKKWQYNPKEVDKYKRIKLNDIKCLAGGLNNFNR